jgi:hypothetical protein
MGNLIKRVIIHLEIFGFMTFLIKLLQKYKNDKLKIFIVIGFCFLLNKNGIFEKVMDSERLLEGLKGI